MDRLPLRGYFAFAPICTSMIFDGVVGGSPRTMFGNTSRPVMTLPHTV